MNGLQLVKSKPFGTVECDFYENSAKDVLMTRKQVGEALGYKDPQNAIDKIHVKNKDRLDMFSVTARLAGTDGKYYVTTLYTAKGVYEICRFSRQPKADEFVDFVWDTIEAIRKGTISTVPVVTPNIMALSGFASTVNALRRIMRDEGSTAAEIAQMAEGLCKQFGIHIPDNFVKEIPGQLTLFNREQLTIGGNVQ